MGRARAGGSRSLLRGHPGVATTCRSWALAAALLSAAQTMAPGARAAVDQLHVLPFRARGGLTETKTKLVDEVFLTELARVAPAGVKLTGHSDVAALIEHDRLKSALTCDDTSCLVEIGSALGASHILVPTLGELADRLVLNAKVLHVESAQVVFRQTLTCSNREQALLETLRLLAEQVAAALGWAAAEQGPTPDPAVESAPEQVLVPAPAATPEPAADPELAAEPEPAPESEPAPAAPAGVVAAATAARAQAEGDAQEPAAEPGDARPAAAAAAGVGRPPAAVSDAGVHIPWPGLIVTGVGLAGGVGASIGFAVCYGQLAEGGNAWEDRDRAAWLALGSLGGLVVSVAVGAVGGVWALIDWAVSDPGAGES